MSYKNSKGMIKSKYEWKDSEFGFKFVDRGLVVLVVVVKCLLLYATK